MVKDYSSLADVQNDLRAGAITAVDLTRSYLERIEQHKNLNVFLEVFTDSALAKAEEVDAKIKY